jgi:hypothetical protein
MLAAGNKELDAFYRAMRGALQGQRYVVAKQFIENCVRVFEGYANDVSQCWWARSFDRFGMKWPLHLLAALVRGFGKTCLFDICDLRAATGPNEIAEFHYRLPLNPGVAQRCAHEALHMVAHRVGWRLPEGQRLEEDQAEFWDTFVDGLFYEVTMDIMGAISQSRADATRRNPPIDVITPRSDLIGEIERQSEDVDRMLGVGEANRLITGPDVAAYLPFVPAQNYEPSSGIHHAGRLLDRWDVYFDPGFRDDTLMLWHHTPGSRDAGTVAYIYSLGFTAEFQSAVIRGTRRALSGEYYRVVRVS